MVILRKLRKERKKKVNKKKECGEDIPFVTDVQINRYVRSKPGKPYDNVIIKFEYMRNPKGASLTTMHDFVREVEKLRFNNRDIWK